MNDTLRAPFPYFGGKSLVAAMVWERFGDVANYVEPFCGSAAVLLARPHPPRVETVNDVDCMIANFWRALAATPDTIAEWCDWPVNEADLHARHLWLVNETAAFRERMKADPDYYDCKVAGWWVWGISQWIGGGWCAGPQSKKLPHLGNAGRGVHRPSRQLPHLSHTGMGVHSKLTNLYADFHAIADRLRGVRVCCGDWTRVLGPSVTVKNGLTGVFLDPPYMRHDRDSALYANESDCFQDVVKWCVEWDDHPLMRIALCGYEGHCEMPDTWTCIPWKANGGYSTRSTGNFNAHRERIWYSPHCLQPELF